MIETASTMNTSESIMTYCLTIAARAMRSVAPNPMVGACLVHDDKIIAEGIHERYGEAHAELNAIRKINSAEILSQSTLYVSLEPCSHFGKTPPCADLIINSGIRQVVVATRDPNPAVAGNGIKKLRQHGIQVTEDILRDQARLLNRRFFCTHLQRRPYVILKWAQTSDGFVARQDYSSKWISGEDSRNLVHDWRAEEQAIMVGARTALYDDPQLTVRNGSGKNPVRIIFDRDNSLPASLKLWNDAAATLCFSAQFRSPHGSEEIILLNRDRETIPQIMEELLRRRIQSVMIEGGPATIRWFISQDLWDEARIFTASHHFGSGIAAPERSLLSLATHQSLFQAPQKFQHDTLETVFNQRLEQWLLDTDSNRDNI